jgi:hydroxypyruvate reductase
LVRSEEASLSRPLQRLRADLHDILRAALEAVDPVRLVANALARGALGSHRIRAAVIVGKAAWPMAAALMHDEKYQAIPGIVAGPAVSGHEPPRSLDRCAPGHPHPNQSSVDAANRALHYASSLKLDESLLVLLSGGASAMLALPAHGISLEDKIATTQALLRAGVAIDGLNAVRKHLSRIKGGRLAAAAPSTMTLALSDVHRPREDDPAVIGSGPTVPDPTTYGDALDVIRDSGAAVPSAVTSHLERGARGEIEETLKPGDPRLARSAFEILGNRHTALEAALRAAQDHGYVAHVLPAATSGEAREAAQQFLSEVKWLATDGPRPLCVLAAGETTVTVRGDGVGGRNQEFALAMASMIGSSGRAAAFASAGTDGVDGPTDAAGAVVDSSTLDRAARAGLDWRQALAANDAYRFFEPLGDLLRWGPTGTNVGDIQVFLVA